MATSRLDWKHYKPLGAELLEDGTLPFLSILALQQGCVPRVVAGGWTCVCVWGVHMWAV